MRGAGFARRMPGRILPGLVLLAAGLVVAGGVPSARAQDSAASSQSSPAAGSLHVPSAAERAAASRPATPPTPAPRAGVQQTAPFTTPMPTPSIATSHGTTTPGRRAPSELGHSAPGHVSPLDRRIAAEKAHAAKEKAHATKPGGKPGAKPPGNKPEGTKAGAPPAAGEAAKAAPQPAPAQPPAPSAAEQPAASPPGDTAVGTSTHLPLPRWASFKTDEVNMRSGPGMQYPIQWVYHRINYPVQILREFDVWRLVEDEEGVKGWVHTATLSNRHGFVVRPGAERVLRGSASDGAGMVARVQPGVVGRVRSCEATATWCEVQVKGYKGWLKRADLYGLSAGEAINP